ncbi:hypothetical protein D3C74_492040 [compost metagenome]
MTVVIVAAGWTVWISLRTDALLLHEAEEALDVRTTELTVFGHLFKLSGFHVQAVDHGLE